MAAPTFTIAMPAYQASATVGAAIRSVLAQTRDDFELVVVDDGSTDGTAEEVERFRDEPRVRLVRQQNRGPAHARNTAVAAARGRYVSMLDSDDLWLPTYLESMESALRANPNAGLAYTDAWVLDDATRRIQRVTAMHYQDPPDPPPSEPDSFLSLLLERNFVFTSATVPRAVLEEVGRFNTELEASEDYELWLRIVARGHEAVRVPGLLAVYRKAAGSVSTDEQRMLGGMARALRLAREEEIPAEAKERARARAERIEAELVARRGAPGLRATAIRARIRAVRAKEAALRPFLWHRRPPLEIEAAFPDLRAL
jgi:glycosyltransferase involved in cell wall biosynthesis